MPDILEKILEARENRALLRNKYAKKRYHTISLSLNIPGYPKTNDQISKFFLQILSELKTFLEANRIALSKVDKNIITDEAGDFFIACLNTDVKLEDVKQITEEFETNHKLGRLIDVDIFDKNLMPVSSGKQKLCYFCEKYPAVECMRKKRHKYSDIRKKIHTEIAEYQKETGKENFIKEICSLANRSLLYEISLSPKPGLVDFNSSGSHNDMNYFTFLNSTASISSYFRDFSLLGFNSDKNILQKIRYIGLQCEKSMFRTTNGVNTQKGLIFLFGICIYSFSKMYSDNIEFTETNFRNIIKKITKNIVENELQNINTPVTHGEKVFAKYGIVGAGVRYEVESGFETIFKTSIPYFKNKLGQETLKNKEKLNEILQIALLKIMSKNNDTNILFRSNLETLNFVKNLSKKTVNNLAEYKNLCQYCTLKNISPGGSADLLAVSLLIHFMFNK